jgi:putative transposase
VPAGYGKNRRLARSWRSRRLRVPRLPPRFTAHLIGAGVDASIGTVGDALDNALMESAIGLYKPELIKKDGPWRSLADVELATSDYVDWFNTRRLHTAIGGISPAGHEAACYLSTRPDPEADPTPEASTKPGRFTSPASSPG